MKKFGLICLVVFLLTGCAQEKEEEKKEEQQIEKIKGQLCSVMDTCQEIYLEASKGEAENVILEEEMVHKMVDLIAEEGRSVTCGGHDLNMRHAKKVEEAILQGERGENAKTEFYEVNKDGYFFYHQLQFKDHKLQVTSASASMDQKGEKRIHQVETFYPYDWKYTDKGWIMWEKEQSKNQEMDQHVFYRVRPLEERCRKACKQYIQPVGYFCNNLFLTNWDETNMESVHLNDLYDFFYEMKEKKEIEEIEREGILKEEFEEVVTSFLPLSVEEIEKYACYDKESGMYPWEPIGMWNREQQFLPFPEVVNYEENEDGTITLTVDAVFFEEGTDCSFRHKVTIREEEGTWKYIKNEIVKEFSNQIPKYKPRSSF